MTTDEAISILKMEYRMSESLSTDCELFRQHLLSSEEPHHTPEQFRAAIDMAINYLKIANTYQAECNRSDQFISASVIKQIKAEIRERSNYLDSIDESVLGAGLYSAIEIIDRHMSREGEND